MSDTNTHKRPSHTVWFAPKRENARWLRIGALWQTKNSGFNITLDLLPHAEGGVVALPFNSRKEDEQDEA